MSIRRRVGLLALLAMCGAGLAESKSSPREQTRFSAEAAGVERPVPVPQTVLAVLQEDEHVRSLLEDENIPAEKIPSSWFSASAIHLSSPQRVDLVVMGQGPLRGANVVTFWVFSDTGDGYALVLRAPAHDLAVKNTRWKRHRDIALISATAVEVTTVLYRFDGKKYRELKTKSEPTR
jgi:hypothetical protein